MPRNGKEKPAPRFFVACYGDSSFGLAVEFFADPLAYGRAVKAAIRDHACGELDSYTCGRVEL